MKQLYTYISEVRRGVVYFVFVFFFKQKTAYEMRISDWSSDVCSSDLSSPPGPCRSRGRSRGPSRRRAALSPPSRPPASASRRRRATRMTSRWRLRRSEEHTSELQSLMRISYAVFCLKKKKKRTDNTSGRGDRKTTDTDIKRQ